MTVRQIVCGALALACNPLAAFAAEAPAAPAQQPVPAIPQTTSATFGDWVLSCQRVGQPPQKKICEVGQTLGTKGQAAPVARFALGRISPSEPLRFTAVLPVNMVPSVAPRLSFGDKPAGAVTLPWQRCLAGGCFASEAVDDAILQRLRAGTDQGHVTFRDAGEHDQTLPVSLRGLAQALDGLAKEDAAR